MHVEIVNDEIDLTLDVVLVKKLLESDHKVLPRHYITPWSNLKYRTVTEIGDCAYHSDGFHSTRIDIHSKWLCRVHPSLLQSIFATPDAC